MLRLAIGSIRQHQNYAPASTIQMAIRECSIGARRFAFVMVDASEQIHIFHPHLQDEKRIHWVHNTPSEVFDNMKFKITKATKNRLRCKRKGGVSGTGFVSSPGRA
jgi:hypothetical protein